MWKIELTKQALKDSKKAQKSLHRDKIEELLKILKNNPYKIPPPYEKLEPPRDNVYSRRINIKHRIVYHINTEQKIVTISSLWTHYENNR
jgi:Txe/YoeB family toxin of toxin-antitoxin system